MGTPLLLHRRAARCAEPKNAQTAPGSDDKGKYPPPAGFSEGGISREKAVGQMNRLLRHFALQRRGILLGSQIGAGGGALPRDDCLHRLAGYAGGPSARVTAYAAHILGLQRTQNAAGNAHGGNQQGIEHVNSFGQSRSWFRYSIAPPGRRCKQVMSLKLKA